MYMCLQPYIYIHIHTNPHPNDTRTQQYPFDFPTVDKPYETYTGLNVRLRYFLRVTVTTKTAYVPNLVAEQDLLVQTTTEVCAGVCKCGVVGRGVDGRSPCWLFFFVCGLN